MTKIDIIPEGKYDAVIDGFDEPVLSQTRDNLIFIKVRYKIRGTILFEFMSMSLSSYRMFRLSEDFYKGKCVVIKIIHIKRDDLDDLLFPSPQAIWSTFDMIELHQTPAEKEE